MALAQSQPPERLGNAAKNPAIVGALQEDLANNSVGGALAQRLEVVEQDLRNKTQENEEMKAKVSQMDDQIANGARSTAEMAKELLDCRVIMSQLNSGMLELARELRRNSNSTGQEGVFDNSANEKTNDAAKQVSYTDSPPASQTPSVGKRISWNEMSQGEDVLSGKKSLKADANEIFQEGGDTADVTVDRWGFKQSCWDSAAFFGDTSLLLMAEAWANLTLLCLNVGIQVCFVIIVFKSLTSSTVDEDAQWGYHMWRTNTGHAVMYMDPLTQESMASRVCRNDQSLYLSTTQMDQVAAINNYIYDNEPFNGPMMAMLAIFVWTLTVSKEFHVLKDMIVALKNVDVGETFITKQGARLVLLQMSVVRRIWIHILIVFRIGIAGSILYAGVMFLAVTISLEDILLNAIALEFILNVDELLYHAMVPMKTRRFLLLLKPLPLRKSHAWKGLDSNLFVWFFASCGFTLFVYYNFLKVEMDRMEASMAEICGGFLAFSYTPTKLGFINWSEQTKDPAQAEQDMKNLERYKVIRDIVDYGKQMGDLAPDQEKRAAGKHYAYDHGMPFLMGPGWTIDNLDGWDVATYSTKLNSACSDVIDNKDFTLKAIAYAGMREALYLQEGNLSVMTEHEFFPGDPEADPPIPASTGFKCKDLKIYCNHFFPPGIQVRTFCPVTCGCRDPGSDLSLPFGAMGCPDTCSQHIEYQEILNAKKCEELNATMLQKDPVYIALLNNYKIAARGWSPSGHGEPTKMAISAADLMVDIGCKAVAIIRSQGVDICEPPDLRPLRWYCPIQCGCHLLDHLPLCPSQCSNYTAPPPKPVTEIIEYFWLQAGIDYVTTGGFAAMLGNPSTGEQVTENQIMMMAAAGGIEAAATNGLVEVKKTAAGPPAYKWLEAGITYVTDGGFLAMLQNPTAGSDVTDFQITMMEAAGGIVAAATNGLVECTANC